MNPAPPGSAPLNYATPPRYSMSPKPRGGLRRGLLGWILVIGLVFAVIMAVRNKSSPEMTEIPLSDFHRLLREGKIEQVTIEDAEVHGKLDRQVYVPAVPTKPILYFRAALPANTASNWQFTQWVLDNATGARVSADSGGSLLMNIVVPLIPWALIFGFIWFFVFRQLRGQSVRGQQPTPVYIVNPGSPAAAPGSVAGVPPPAPQPPPGA
jgi:ATP-dependent Zn protease